MIKIEQVTDNNFNENSLDLYVRTQDVKRVYRKQGSEYVLVDMPYIEDWTFEKKRSVAKDICGKEYISYIALDNNQVVGFIVLKRQLVGEYMILDMMHTSAEYRGKGLGRKFFGLGKETSRKAGAKALYISACSSEKQWVRK